MAGELTMDDDSVQKILIRLYGCKAVLEAVHTVMADSSPYLDSVYGVLDLLDHICCDFGAEIDSAVLRVGKGAEA